MTRLLRFSFALLCLCSCSVESFPRDTQSPHIVSVTPSVLPAHGGVIEVHFSEPVVSVKSIDTCLRFAKTAEVSEATLKKMAKQKNPDAAGPFLPIIASLSESHDKISVALPQNLSYAEPYSLWIFDCLRDYAGNRLEPTNLELSLSEFKFQVEDGPFTLVSHDVELLGEHEVAANRKYFHFRFSHCLADLPKDAILLDGRSLVSSLSSDRLSVKAELQTAMEPASNHVFSFGTFYDQQQRALVVPPLQFKTQPAFRAQEVSLIKDFRLLSYENHAEITFHVLHLEQARLRYGTSAENLDVMLESADELFNLQGLEPLMTYYYVLEVENIFGHSDEKRGSFNLSPVATLAINEILASPKLKKGESDASAEFVELYNYGEQPIDLTHFTIEVNAKGCLLSRNSESLVIAPQSYLLIVGKKFDPSHLGLKDSNLIWRVPRQSICGNLRNWPLPNIVVRDDLGRVVDRFDGMPTRKDKGMSVERLNPSEKNGKEKYCYSRSDTGPTPLRSNGVVEKGCENN